MLHGGDIYSSKIEYDFSVSLNPADCSELAKKIMEKSLNACGCYPDYDQRAFRSSLAEMMKVKQSEVFGTNGASEALMCTLRMINPRRVMIIEPCFSGYRAAVEPVEGCKIISFLTDEECEFALGENFLTSLSDEGEKGLDLLIISNPNNPTGLCLEPKMLLDILEICREYKIKLVVDECFINMSDSVFSMNSYINTYDGLFVINAFTKMFSIPGIRVGFVVSCESNIRNLRKYLPEWNMSVIAQNCGEICAECLNQTTFMSDTKELITSEREYLSTKLREFGFKVFKSDTCFMLFKSENHELAKQLADKGILIRDCSNFNGLGNGYFRIGIKSRTENDILLNAIAAGR